MADMEPKDQIQQDEVGETFGFVYRAVAFDEDLSPAARHVYMALATRADSDRKCWPSRSTIEKDTGRSRSGVYRALKELEEAGYLAIKENKTVEGRHFRAHVYTLLDCKRAKAKPTSRIRLLNPGGPGGRPKKSQVEPKVGESDFRTLGAEVGSVRTTPGSPGTTPVVLSEPPLVLQEPPLVLSEPLKGTGRGPTEEDQEEEDRRTRTAPLRVAGSVARASEPGLSAREHGVRFARGGRSAQDREPIEGLAEIRERAKLAAANCSWGPDDDEPRSSGPTKPLDAMARMRQRVQAQSRK